MADIYDVQMGLASLAQSAIYPNGVNNPSIVNLPVKIYPGWPLPQTLDNDLANNIAHVSIFPTSISRPTTRLDTQWLESIVETQTLIFTIDEIAKTITFSGAINYPQTIVFTLNGYDYYYTVQLTDTLNDIAYEISLMVPGAYSIVNVAYFVIMKSIAINASIQGTAIAEYAREQREIYVSVWAPTPQVRSNLLEAVADLFSITKRIIMPDNLYAAISFYGTDDRDELEKVICYRSDLYIMAEYAFTITNTYYSIAQNIIDVNSIVSSPEILFQLLNGGNFLLLNTQNLGLLE